MEKLILKNICNGKKWYEKVKVRISKKSHIEAYKQGVKDCFNNLHKD